MRRGERDDERGAVFDKAPPQNNEAEMCVLGCCVLSDRAADEVGALIQPEHFYVPAHRVIYEALTRLKQRGSAVDLVTVRDELISRGQLAMCGGVEYLMQVVEAVPSAQNAMHYAGIVLDKALLRSFESAARESIGMVHDPHAGTPREILAKGMALVAAVSAQSTGAKVWDIADIADEIPKGVPSGLVRLDQLLDCGGLPNGQASCVKAKTGVGKTPFLCQTALTNFRAKKHVVYALFADLTPAQWKARMVRSVSGVGRVRTIEDEQRRRDAIAELDDFAIEHRITLYDGTGTGAAKHVESFVSWLLAHDAKLRAESGGKAKVDVVICDYLQRITTAQKCDGLYERNVLVGEALNDMAKTMKEASTLVASQVNRDGTARYGAEFEQDAALLVALERNADDQALFDVTIEKSRFSPMATLNGLRRDEGTLLLVDPKVPVETQYEYNEHGYLAR